MQNEVLNFRHHETQCYIRINNGSYWTIGKKISKIINILTQTNY